MSYKKAIRILREELNRMLESFPEKNSYIPFKHFNNDVRPAPDVPTTALIVPKLT